MKTINNLNAIQGGVRAEAKLLKLMCDAQDPETKKSLNQIIIELQTHHPELVDPNLIYDCMIAALEKHASEKTKK